MTHNFNTILTRRSAVTESNNSSATHINHYNFMHISQIKSFTPPSKFVAPSDHKQQLYLSLSPRTCPIVKEAIFCNINKDKCFVRDFKHKETDESTRLKF